MGPGSDGPLGAMAGMEPHHMNGSLGNTTHHSALNQHSSEVFGLHPHLLKTAHVIICTHCIKWAHEHCFNCFTHGLIFRFW